MIVKPRWVFKKGGVWVSVRIIQGLVDRAD